MPHCGSVADGNCATFAACLPDLVIHCFDALTSMRLVVVAVAVVPVFVFVVLCVS